MQNIGIIEDLIKNEFELKREYLLKEFIEAIKDKSDAGDEIHSLIMGALITGAKTFAERISMIDLNDEKGNSI